MHSASYKCTISAAMRDEKRRDEMQEAAREKRGALQAASGALLGALREAMALRQSFPELVREIRKDLPYELVDLWRPDLTFDAFDDIITLATDSRHKVYKARIKDKTYALKEFTLATDTGLKDLFREAALLRRMRHPAVVEVLGVFEDTIRNNEEVMFLQMPFFELGTVDEWIESERPEWHAVRLVLFDIAGALEHLHSYSVVHCDVKPSNILVEASRSKRRGCLADFDISVSARTRTVTATTLVSKTLAFTPGFDAPELRR
jgi:serine/threonine protein kinase